MEKKPGRAKKKHATLDERIESIETDQPIKQTVDFHSISFTDHALIEPLKAFKIADIIV